jgi:hypothetical protein
LWDEREDVVHIRFKVGDIGDGLDVGRDIGMRVLRKEGARSCWTNSGFGAEVFWR